MRIGYFPDFKTIMRSSAVKRAPASRRYRVQVAAPGRFKYNSLEIDAHTLKDLEIFQAETSGKSLFQLCNFTTTQGGAQILRQRMEHPFTDARHIKQAQQSITHILAHRQLFKQIGFWITGRVERYQRDPLMLVAQNSPIGFTFGAISLKLLDSHHYFRIFRGVQFTCLLIRSLRAYLRQTGRYAPEGELVSICEDMRKILNRPRFRCVPEGEIKGVRFWKVLRLDQTFRISDKEQVQELLRLVYEIDALMSMAEATVENGYSIPEVLDGPTCIRAEGLVHPQVENPVPNEVNLDQDNRLLFLTGPNMAGKTTYLRAVATALFFGHLGMGVPARSFSFAPVDRLFSSISISDDVHTGTSYFLAEVLRIKAVADAIAKGLRVVAILDEPFKGTNVIDALEASLAVMSRLESKANCLFLFSSHLIELDDRFDPSANIKRCHFEAKESGGLLQFDFTLHPGVSSQRLGMRVLSEQGVFDLLDRRHCVEKSSELLSSTSA